MSKSEEILKNLEQNLPAVPVAPITPEVKNDREIEDFLNKAQEQFTKDGYAAWKNRPQIVGDI